VDLLGACQDHGIDVPARLSIVGQGNDREKNVVRPRLTTIDTHIQDVGRQAARMALDLIDGKPPESIVVEPELIVQESTAAV
jgi:DNA-binding LacI/PurR family transcriptional regulator